MDIEKISMFFQKVGQEVWENGELSPSNKAILRSISVNQIRQYREQFQQMVFQESRRWANTPVRQELLDAAINCAQVFSNDFDYYVKDCLDILCDNKGNAIINKLLSRTSQYINNYVVVEDTDEIDDATYQQMRSQFKQFILLFQEQMRNHGFTKVNEERVKEILRNLSEEDIRTIREVLRKFALKAIDTETEIYSQIPPVWRAEAKNFFKSAVNLCAGVLDENLIYDCLQIGLDATYNNINQEEIQNRIFKRLAQQLNQWAAQRKLYVKKASSAGTAKILPLTQQLTIQFNETNNYQIQQLQAEIKRLQKQIQDLKAEREREREQRTRFRWFQLPY
ncbi:hypothetical protein [endosymbiont GvMRE of Glomus versiforme]|uniref:hypothetical protein n=1 Tax=endosymbiont GvMRE of Glomus versiforme TaxID=2039283 RepID=UPI000EDCE2FB|nr:hypothetical protein [endosymbiont GvMRE of Glomus versiforme]RHZ37344.1 hypothetical protein GvMRE_I1g595 [endosymbiont GvMRE of Glomus versiforme]